MSTFLLFAFGAIGMTLIIVDSGIMQWFRDWYKSVVPEKLGQLVDCYMCCGFWCGMFCAWASFSTPTVWSVIVGAFAGSFLANLAATLLNWMEAGTIINLEQSDGD
jgi:prepilin signal peptidase PulO-like enzyme (type II secretory pathway)